SLYALFRYDSTFSKFGIFSPALWIADSIYLLPKLYSHQRQTRIYLMSGLLESASQVQEIYNFRDSLFKHGFSRNAVRCVIKDDGIHSEWFWKREFAACYQWLFAPPSAEERNKEIKKSDFDFELTPTSYQLNVRTNGLSGNSKVDVLDEKGILLVRKTIGESGSLHLKQLRKGKYTVKIINGNLTSSKTFEKK
ncbi:MAG TPA: T9SS type A sorting domain-containing protein, partial [Acinetobacter sp.]|nr:T9SS type A sorting domain-containing protein [Acinetobacter sp.]